MSTDTHIDFFLVVKNGAYVLELGEVWKRCRACGEVKPLGEYYKHQGMKDNLHAECKLCHRNRGLKNKEIRCQRLKTIPETKRCGHCGTVRSSEEFYLDSTSSTGLSSYCNVCNTKRTQEYLSRPGKKEEQRKRRKKHYLKNRDKYLEMSRIYYWEHRESYIEKGKLRHKQNKEGINQKHREYYQEHAEDWTERARADRLANPEKYRIKQQRYLARVKSLDGSFTDEQWIKLCNLSWGKCLCCGEKGQTVDHIIPATWPGSTNFIDNVQPLCLSCNSSKGNRHDVDYRPNHIREWAEREVER